MREVLDREGFAVVPGLVSPAVVASLIAFFEEIAGGQHGVRDILGHSEVRSFVELSEVRALALAHDPFAGPP